MPKCRPIFPNLWSEPGVCFYHGGRWDPDHGCPTEDVLRDLLEHRAVQFSRYGSNDGLQDGTGPDVRWLSPLTRVGAIEIEAELRREYNLHGQNPSSAPTSDDITWLHLVREEVTEAFKESDQVRLREELVQVASLCVSWIEKLDTRPSKIVPEIASAL